MPNTHERCSNHVFFVVVGFFLYLVVGGAPTLKISFSFYSNKSFAFSIENKNRLSCVIRCDCCIFFIHRNSLSMTVASGVLSSFLSVLHHAHQINNVFQFQMKWLQQQQQQHCIDQDNDSSIIVLNIFLYFYK